MVGLCALMGMLAVSSAQAQQSVVHAVLFYSPSCPHCHTVMEEDLPPLMEQYGDQLQIASINTAHPEGQELYRSTIEQYALPDHRIGVPALVVDDRVLVGSIEIPEQFPVLVKTYLSQGGVGWPDIPGLAEAMQEGSEPAAPAAGAEAVAPESAQEGTGALAPGIQPERQTGLAAALSRDPVGNSLALLVLVGMVLVVGYTAVAFRRADETAPPVWQAWTIPLLAVVGLGVAGYLAYVETNQVAAICGPVGDCNTVQQSPYAYLFGIPVGVLGLVGYVGILAAWATGRFGQGRTSTIGWLTLFVMALVGTLFSIYLTFLEPFVIGATCAWCLASSIIMAAILWLAAPQGRQAFARLSGVPDRAAPVLRGRSGSSRSR
jgi:uncharacterized membrane protein/glutaredoxin-related protein